MGLGGGCDTGSWGWERVIGFIALIGVLVLFILEILGI